MRKSKTAKRGFTLVEMLAVVAMVGILATLAVYSVRKYVFAAKSSEAMLMVNAIKAHQETYKDETYTYLNVTGGTDYSPLYPMATPDGRKYAWWNDSDATLYANWRRLGADASGPVVFGYACIAGAAGVGPANPGTLEDLNFPTPVEPWYVIKAVGDNNPGGAKAIVVASSFTREIHVENESE
jgi:type IV pilus assembly protein PilA